jgi:hypothetical protein
MRGVVAKRTVEMAQRRVLVEDALRLVAAGDRNQAPAR